MKDPGMSSNTINSFDDVNGRLKIIADHDSFITTAEAEMNEKINKIRAEFDEATKDARAHKTLIEQEIEGFCKVNKSTFDSQRSKPLLFGKVFFRTAPPKVSQLNKKYSVDTTLELIQKLFKGKFIREKKEIDKDQILTAYASKDITDEKLAAVGLRIDQQEKFGYEINWEALKSK